MSCGGCWQLLPSLTFWHRAHILGRVHSRDSPCGSCRSSCCITQAPFILATSAGNLKNVMCLERHLYLFCCCRIRVPGPQFFPQSFPPSPTSFTLSGKGSPPDFVAFFLNIFIVSFKRNVLHSSSKEQRTELLTIALALTAVPSTPFPRKVNSQVLIGQPSRGKMREAASSPSRALVWRPELMDLTSEALSCGPGRRRHSGEHFPSSREPHDGSLSSQLQVKIKFSTMGFLGTRK